MKIDKEEFVKRLLQIGCGTKDLLSDDYDMIREAGMILVDEAEVRQKIKELSNKKPKCVSEWIALAYQIKILREILGEEAFK